MKLRRILAASTAAAIVASAMAVTSFADEKAFSGSVSVTSTGGWWDQVNMSVDTLIGDIDPADVTKIVVATDEAAQVGYNSSATADWAQFAIEAGGSIELTDVDLGDSYDFLFATSSDKKFTANITWDVYAEAAASDDTTTDDTTGDEIVDGDDAATDGDEIVGGDDTITDGDDATTDDAGASAGDVDIWASYDLEAAQAANAAAVYPGKIDIYAVVGDAYGDIATVELDLSWDAATTVDGFNGGCGIGYGVVFADGTEWQQGAEFGTYNNNEGIVSITDGKGTYVAIDISANPITEIATVAEDGTVSFAQLDIQNWWQGVDAGVQIDAVRFLDADGNIIGEELVFAEAPAADGDDATGNTDGATDEDKNSADTGVEGVAVAAGALALAGAAVIASRKRK